MKIQRYKPEDFAYGIPCQPLYPWEGVADTPFGSMWCVVEPGRSVKTHKHHEAETYIFAQGNGFIRVGGESLPVGPGDAVFMDPFETHEVVNPPGGETVLFLAVWWEDLQLAKSAGEKAESAADAARPRRTVIIATPPTPNGDLHVGHLSGPYLAADIHKRYLLSRGVDAIYLSGADDHQSYVPAKGRKLGIGPREVADRFGDLVEESLAMAAIELDLFVRPKTSRHHIPFVAEFFKALHAKGAFVEKEAPGLYCETCDKYLYEAHVSGRCPHCGAGADGNSCEQCGWPNQVVDLVDPACKYCGGRPAVRPVKRLYFPLSRHRDGLSEWHRRVKMSSHLRTLCTQMIEDLPDVAACHPTDWGIPVPVAGYEDQTIYAWLEMAPGFLAAAEEALAKRGEPGTWRDALSGDAGLVQFFGFDNSYYFAVLFPALWMAYDPEIPLPTAFVTNEFLRLDGAKFSTSRGHAIWGHEILARTPADVLRFYLAWAGPEREQTNFTLPEMEATVERELVEGWQGWLRDLGSRIDQHYGGVAQGSGGWTDDHQQFFGVLTRTSADVAACYEAATFSPARAVRLLSELVRQARRFGVSERHWAKLANGVEELRNGLGLELAAARLLAILAAPILPDLSRRLWQALGYPAPAGPLAWEDAPQFVPHGNRLALTAFELAPPVAAGREVVVA